MNDDIATAKPSIKLPDIFPPSIGNLKSLTGKRANNAMKKQVVKPPLMPKALQQKNESKLLLDRIKS